jgi:hypothetical protein
MTKIRYVEGNWEVTEDDGRVCFFSGSCALTNLYAQYQNIGKLLDEARAHPVAFNCEELAPHFRKFIRFRNGSWERRQDELFQDGRWVRLPKDTWVPKSCQAAIRGCLAYHGLHLRPKHFKEMLAYLKANPQ